MLRCRYVYAYLCVTWLNVGLVCWCIGLGFRRTLEASQYSGINDFNAVQAQAVLGFEETAISFFCLK